MNSIPSNRVVHGEFDVCNSNGSCSLASQVGIFWATSQMQAMLMMLKEYLRYPENIWDREAKSIIPGHHWLRSKTLGQCQIEIRCVEKLCLFVDDSHGALIIVWHSTGLRCKVSHTLYNVIILFVKRQMLSLTIYYYRAKDCKTSSTVLLFKALKTTNFIEWS